MKAAHLVLYFVALVVLVAAPASAETTLTADELVEIEKSVIGSRRGIETGHVTLILRHNIARDASRLARTKRYDVYFKDNRLRADSHTTSPNEDYSSQRILTHDVFIRATGATKPVQVFGASTKQDNSIEVPDPRRLGLVVWHFDTINQFGYETHFLKPNRYDLRVSSNNHEGEPTWNVSYRFKTRSGEGTTEYWLAKEKGNQPIFISVQSGDGLQSIQTTLARHEYGNDILWFPKSVVFRSKKGDQIIAEEMITVERAQFGFDIDDDAFEIAGLNLSKGRVVDMDGTRMIWTSKGLVPREPALSRDESHRGRASWFIAAASAIFATAAAITLWARLRRG
jgi:hypothetical protein